MNTIQAEWEIFRTNTNLAAAPEAVQRMGEVAFYSGVLVCLDLHQHLAHTNVSNKAKTAMIAGWWDEMERFDRKLRK